MQKTVSIKEFCQTLPNQKWIIGYRIKHKTGIYGSFRYDGDVPLVEEVVLRQSKLKKFKDKHVIYPACTDGMHNGDEYVYGTDVDSVIAIYEFEMQKKLSKTKAKPRFLGKMFTTGYKEPVFTINGYDLKQLPQNITLNDYMPKGEIFRVWDSLFNGERLSTQSYSLKSMLVDEKGNTRYIFSGLRSDYDFTLKPSDTLPDDGVLHIDNVSNVRVYASLDAMNKDIRQLLQSLLKHY